MEYVSGEDAESMDQVRKAKPAGCAAIRRANRGSADSSACGRNRSSGSEAGQYHDYRRREVQPCEAAGFRLGEADGAGIRAGRCDAYDAGGRARDRRRRGGGNNRVYVPGASRRQAVDARSDIFSFGSLLYEMVTGRRAFQGDTAMSTLSAILKDEPKPLSQIAGDVPPEVERLISRCLRKDPGEACPTYRRSQGGFGGIAGGVDFRHIRCG